MLRPLLALVGVSFSTIGACSTFDPSVGPLQHDGATVAACSLGSNGYGSSYGSPTGQAAANDFCTSDGGSLESACDLCEAASCCAQRVACYTDQTCSCADSALDPCASAAADASADALKTCWTAFSMTSAIAAARYQCLRTSCPAACKIPS
jgi:hypothetical protein